MNKGKIHGGYILLSRLVYESAIWRDDPHILKLFIWLVGKARHDKKPKKYPSCSVNRGELITSLDMIVEDNEYIENNGIRRWSRTKVSRMLKRLEEQGYVSLACDTYGTHVIVCNYDRYQDPDLYARNKGETAPQQLVTAPDTYNNENNDNNDNNCEKEKANSLLDKMTFSAKEIEIQNTAKKVIIMFNEKTDSNYPDFRGKHMDAIKSLLRDDVPFGDFVMVLDKKRKDTWFVSNGRLTPDILYGENFDKYMQEDETKYDQDNHQTLVIE